MPADPLAPHAASPAELGDRLAAERAGTPFLVLRDADDRQRIVPLSGTRAGVGRGVGNEVALPWDPEVSRLHAELELVGGSWLVCDDRLSHNGTYVNGERLHGRRRLRSGDVITAGGTQLGFVAPAAGVEDATRTAAHASGAVAVTPAQRRVLIALCRPVGDGGAPASNRDIADELVLALDTVKGVLSRLFETFGIGADVPQNQKRAALARRALALGVVTPDELLRDRSA